MVKEKLKGQNLNDQYKLLDNDETRPYAYLGVIGGALGDFIPAFPEYGPSPPNSPYFRAWLRVLRLFAGNPAQAGLPNSERQGFYYDLKQIGGTLAHLADVIANQDENQLLNMKGEMDQCTAALADLQALLNTLSQIWTKDAIFTEIQMGGPKTKVASTRPWALRDTMHWSYTGRFLQALYDLAKNDKQRAYVLGATVGYAIDLCGNAYINGVASAPYRNHWWRHRYIANYIDTWVFGYYGAGGANSVRISSTTGLPDPPYEYSKWPNVCCAKLQNQIATGSITDPQTAATFLDTIMQSIKFQDSKHKLPKLSDPDFLDFLDFWRSAYEKAYGTLPVAPDSGLDVTESLQNAYVITWLTLWLQTSGEAIPCLSIDQIPLPDGCGTMPSWVNPDGSLVVAKKDKTTGVVTVVKTQASPAPYNATKTSTKKTVSGALGMIFFGIVWVFSAFTTGWDQLKESYEMWEDGQSDPDWDEWSCYVQWLSVYFYEMTNGLHDMLRWGGFGFPFPQDLAHNKVLFQQTPPVVSPDDAAFNTVYFRMQAQNYPASLWTPTASDWNNPPTSTQETPAERAYGETGPTWPYHFADGFEYATPTPTQINPLKILKPGGPPLARDRNEWNNRRGNLNSPNAIEVCFGNAVDVSLDLIKTAKANATPSPFLDWDLDGDPGIGFPTWLSSPPPPPRNAQKEA